MAGPVAQAQREARRPDRRAALVAGTTVLALAILLWGGYVRHWRWTGFDANDTLWDWLELALLPTAVATLPLWLRHRPLLHRRGRRALVAAVVALAALVAAGYLVPLAWTGFPGNTLWDWLKLVALPVVLVFLGPWTEVARKVRTHPRRHVIAFAVAAFAALAVAGYVIPLAWTGFPGNTLWDWLQLLLLPVLVPTVLGPALLAWIATEEPRAERAGATAAAGTVPARGRPRLAWAAAGGAIGLVALAAGMAVGDAVASRPAPGGTGPCDRAGAATLAADGSARVVRAGRSLYACRPGAAALRVAPSAGSGRPADLTLAAGRVVYVPQACRPGTAACTVVVDVLRLSDGRRFARARFARSGPVRGLAVSPGGALAVMLGAACRDRPACAPARLALIDARGKRVADSGPALDTRSLAAAGTTVFWRRAGRAVSQQLSG
jgi:hypothetical protein